MIMPSLLLQKPSKESISKDHLKALRRRMELWQSGDLLKLLPDSLAIQKYLESVIGSKTMVQISKTFVEEMQKGNLNGAMKLLTDNMDHGILPLNDESISKIKKHPQTSAPDPINLLLDEVQNIHSIKYEDIAAEEVRKVAINTKEGSGPSGLDADGWRRILASSCFGDSSADLFRAIASITRKLRSEKLDASSLEAFLACRLIPLDKNPGLRPTVDGTLRRIAGTVVVSFTRNEIIDSVGSLQVCAGHEAGCEALIHAMNNIFQDEQTEAVLLVDAANAFNAVNHKSFLRNINIICPSIAAFVHNCYSRPNRSFVFGGVEIASSEGTTQGDPVAMAVYAIAIIPLILIILNIDNTESYSEGTSKAAAYADDLTAAGCIPGLKYWWDQLCELGPKFGYFPQASKSWLIIRPEVEGKAKTIFQGSGV